MTVRKKYDRSVLGRGLDDMGAGRGLDALIDTGNVHTQGSSLSTKQLATNIKSLQENDAGEHHNWLDSLKFLPISSQ